MNNKNKKKTNGEYEKYKRFLKDLNLNEKSLNMLDYVD